MPVAIAIGITILGGFKEIDKSKEVACMLIIHRTVKGSIVTVYVSFSDCILTLAQDRDKDYDVLKGAKQKRHHE